MSLQLYTFRRRPHLLRMHVYARSTAHAPVLATPRTRTRTRSQALRSTQEWVTTSAGSVGQVNEVTQSRAPQRAWEVVGSGAVFQTTTSATASSSSSSSSSSAAAFCASPGFGDCWVVSSFNTSATTSTLAPLSPSPSPSADGNRSYNLVVVATAVSYRTDLRRSVLANEVVESARLYDIPGERGVVVRVCAVCFGTACGCAPNVCWPMDRYLSQACVTNNASGQSCARTVVYDTQRRRLAWTGAGVVGVVVAVVVLVVVVAVVVAKVVSVVSMTRRHVRARL